MGVKLAHLGCLSWDMAELRLKSGLVKEQGFVFILGKGTSPKDMEYYPLASGINA